MFSLTGECTQNSGCLHPENLVISDITAESASIMWDEIGAAINWKLEYGESGFSLGSGIVISDIDGTPGIELTNLAFLTTYDLYLKSICTENEESEYFGPFSFTTKDIYCSIEELDWTHPITSVNFAGILNSTGPYDGWAQEFFLNQQATVERGATYPITCQGSTVTFEYNPYYEVYFDWDQDHVFNTTTNERYEIGMTPPSNGIDGIQVSADILVPENATLGLTRMRVIKHPPGLSSPCGSIILQPVMRYYCAFLCKSLDVAGFFRKI